MWSESRIDGEARRLYLDSWCGDDLDGQEGHDGRDRSSVHFSVE